MHASASIFSSLQWNVFARETHCTDQSITNPSTTRSTHLDIKQQIPAAATHQQRSTLLGAKRLRGRVRTPLADLRALEIEQNGDGHQDSSNAAQQRAGPLDAHALEHVRREQWEARAAEGAEEGVCGNGGGGELFRDLRQTLLPSILFFSPPSAGGLKGTMVGWGKTDHQIGIDQIIQALQENCHQAKTGAEAAQRGNDPVDVLGVASPGKPK